MKLLLLVCGLVLLVSCNSLTKKPPENEQVLCDRLIYLHFKDQEFRGLDLMQDPFFKVLDSLIESNGMTRSEYAKLTKEEQLGFGKLARSISEK